MCVCVLAYLWWVERAGGWVNFFYHGRITSSRRVAIFDNRKYGRHVVFSRARIRRLKMLEIEKELKRRGVVRQQSVLWQQQHCHLLSQLLISCWPAFDEATGKDDNDHLRLQ